jgi:trk system potassium uptake protein
MNIVIVGAGEIGRYIADILSKGQHNITLIDPNSKVLEEIAFNLDVATRVGSGTDWQLLDDLLEFSPHLLIALTHDDEVNLVSCSIAKNLGYPRTVARVRDNRYLNRMRLDFGRIFDVDYFIGPELLVAHDILKYMLAPGSLAAENFAHGAVQMRTLAVPSKWRKSNVPLSQLDFPVGMMVGLIHRHIKNEQEESEKIIFPHGEDCLYPGDEVTFIGESDVIEQAHRFFGLTQKKIQSVVLVGGSLTAINLAKLLEHHHIKVRLIEKSYEVCSWLADQLPHTHIIHHDATHLEFLKSEKIGSADVLVTCTESDETNLMVGLLGKQVGCQDVVAMLTNPSYSPFISRLGLNMTVSPRISAANHILSQVLSGKVITLVSLYDNQAEIMELNVSMNSKLIGIPLSELGPLLPKDFLICVIQNRGRIMIANGDRIISPGDTVIVMTNPRHAKDLENIF